MTAADRAREFFALAKDQARHGVTAPLLPSSRRFWLAEARGWLAMALRARGAR
jgi:hypothetical protein